MQQDTIEYGAMMRDDNCYRVKHVNNLHLFILVKGVWEYLHPASLPFVLWDHKKSWNAWATPTLESIEGYVWDKETNDLCKQLSVHARQ